jgi:hypothetical protein
MVYRNITLSTLSEFVRNLDNFKQIHTAVMMFSYDEMLGFIMLQQNHRDLHNYLTEQHPEVFKSLVDKLASADSNLAKLCIEHNTVSEDEAHRFAQRFAIASKIKIHIAKRTLSAIHDFEKRYQKLACDMNEEEIMEIAKTSSLGTSASFRQNFLNPLVNYMQEEVELNLADTINPLLVTGFIRDLDFSNIIASKDFKDIDDLRDYLTTIFPAIGQNIHTNRSYLAAIMCYLGVRPEDILNVRSADLKGNVLEYKRKKIILPEDCMTIINQWNEEKHYYMMKSGEVEALEPTVLLIQSHRTITPTLISTMLKDYSIAKNVDYYTMRDIFRSGEYDRYRRTKINEVSESRKSDFAFDYAAWERIYFPEENQKEKTEEE